MMIARKSSGTSSSSGRDWATWSVYRSVTQPELWPQWHGRRWLPLWFLRRPWSALSLTTVIRLLNVCLFVVCQPRVFFWFRTIHWLNYGLTSYWTIEN